MSDAITWTRNQTIVWPK